MKFNSIVRNLYDKYFVIAGLQKEFLDCYFKERLTNKFLFIRKSHKNA